MTMYLTAPCLLFHSPFEPLPMGICILKGKVWVPGMPLWKPSSSAGDPKHGSGLTPP